MPRGARLSAEELRFIKAGIERLSAIKADRPTRYPRATWNYVCEFTGRSEKCIKAIMRGEYGQPGPSSPKGDEPEDPDANDWRLPLFLAASMMSRVTSFFIVFSSFFRGPAVVLAVPDRQGVVFVLWAFAHVYTFLRKRSPTAVLSARADCDSQSQSNLFRPAFILSVSHHSRFRIDSADLARTCAVIVNVPDLKAYSSVAAKLLRRVTSYASSEALLFQLSACP